MFTGIVTHLARVISLKNSDDVNVLSSQDGSLDFKKSDKKDLELRIILLSKHERDLDIGCSISCMGICLTLTKKQGGKNEEELFFSVSSETVEKTNISSWKENQIINIEFSLRLQDELGGHLVLGHVDCTAKICDIIPSAGSKRVFVKVEDEISKMIAAKGSICLNGVSLTVNSVTQNIFEINIIEATLQNTSFGSVYVGEVVNLEVDVISRYVYNALKTR